MPTLAADSPAPADPRDSFLALLPAIQAHARTAFRFLRSEHDREDAAAEVVTRAWERFVTDPHPLAGAADRLAVPAVAAVRSELARPRC
jgi:hypothetical protein